MSLLPEWVDLPQRKATRHPVHDYTQPGMYFITACVHDMVPLLGKVVAGEMQLNGIGRMVDAELKAISQHWPTASLDVGCVMPNHFHCTILLVAPSHGQPTVSISDVVRRIKSTTAAFYLPMRRELNALHLPEKLWQRSFHDRYLRNDMELDWTRQYILNNPLAWELEKSPHPVWPF